MIRQGLGQTLGIISFNPNWQGVCLAHYDLPTQDPFGQHMCLLAGDTAVKEGDKEVKESVTCVCQEALRRKIRAGRSSAMENETIIDKWSKRALRFSDS